MNFITDTDIQKAAMNSMPNKFISIEHYEPFKNGVKFAEEKVDSLVELAIECALSDIHKGKSIKEIKEYFINYMDEIKDL